MATGATGKVRGGVKVYPDDPQQTKSSKSRHKGRNYWDITKVAIKITALVALGVLGISALIALAAGITLLLSPTFFGAGAFITSVGAGLGTLVGKMVTFAAAQAVLITIAGASLTAGTALLGGAWSLFIVCEGRNAKVSEAR